MASSSLEGLLGLLREKEALIEELERCPLSLSCVWCFSLSLSLFSGCFSLSSLLLSPCAVCLFAFLLFTPFVLLLSLVLFCLLFPLFVAAPACWCAASFSPLLCVFFLSPCRCSRSRGVHLFVSVL